MKKWTKQIKTWSKARYKKFKNLSFAKQAFIALLILVGGYWMLVRPVQVRLEYAQFQKADREIDNLYAQIVEKVGEPDKVVEDDYCRYQSRKYSKGPRSCNVRKLILYEISGVERANSLVQAISTLPGMLELKARYPDENPDLKFTRSELRSDQILSQKIKTNSGLSCGVQYNYPVLPSGWRVIKSDGDENLQITISCGKAAMAEYYPVN